MLKEYLRDRIARVVLYVPDTNPKANNAVYRNEVAYTKRPGWAGKGGDLLALPGGGIDVNDFIKVLQTGNLADDNYIPSDKELINAARRAAKRELKEELKLFVPLYKLEYLGIFQKESPYISYVFIAELAKKPEVVVKPESGGTVWIGADNIEEKSPEMLADHAWISQEAVNAVRQRKKD